MKRILLVHNYYKIRGGEDSVLEDEMALLKAQGNEVRLYKKENLDVKGAFAPLVFAMHTIFSFSSFFALKKIMREWKPDVVHVHNFFPQISPAVFWAAKSENIPVVMSVHNYRLTCVNGLLLRKGSTCELCVGKLPWRGVVHACYRGSRLASLSVASMLVVHKFLGTWNNKIDAFLCFTEFAKNKLKQQGLPAERIHVLRGFIDLPENSNRDFEPQNSYALYLGRLSEEKGIAALVELWKGIPYPLKIVGKGPQEQNIIDSAQGNSLISLDTKADRASALQYLDKARVLIVPSVCFEGGIPMVVKEAFAKGVPVIASRIGGLSEVIEEGENGYTFSMSKKEELNKALETIFSQDQLWMKMSQGALATHHRIFSSKMHIASLRKLYSSLKG